MVSPSLVAQMVKNLPAMQETWFQPLGWDDLLEEGMANPSSIVTWRIPVDRGAQWATDHRVAKTRTQLSDKAQHTVPLYGVGRKGYYLEHKCNQQKNQDNFN